MKKVIIAAAMFLLVGGASAFAADTQKVEELSDARMGEIVGGWQVYYHIPSSTFASQWDNYDNTNHNKTISVSGYPFHTIPSGRSAQVQCQNSSGMFGPYFYNNWTGGNPHAHCHR